MTTTAPPTTEALRDYARARADYHAFITAGQPLTADEHAEYFTALDIARARLNAIDFIEADQLVLFAYLHCTEPTAEEATKP